MTAPIPLVTLAIRPVTMPPPPDTPFVRLLQAKWDREGKAYDAFRKHRDEAVYRTDLEAIDAWFEALDSKRRTA